MASWQEDYLAALDERDSIEMANHSIYLAYTKLADRTANTANAANANKDPITELASDTANLAVSKDKAPPAPPAGDQSSNLNAMLISIRTDLTEAQKMRADLQSRLDTVATELERLKEKSAAEGKRIRDLTTERSHLMIRLRDRDEELKGKSKLLENVQDELVSLNLHLNMEDERNKKLKKENQDLIDRWMARMGQEADALNEASKFS